MDKDVQEEYSTRTNNTTNETHRAGASKRATSISVTPRANLNATAVQALFVVRFS